MPDLKEMKVLIIGPGPATIGQTVEGHEGALEACNTLNAAGCRLITVDANPDAVFNAKPWSQQPVIAPLVPETITQIIEMEKPDAVLSLFSGRNGLQLLSRLYRSNTFEDRHVKSWGPSRECLDKIRDRDSLNSALTAIGLKTPSIHSVDGVEAAIEKAQQLGFPVVLRCDDAHVLPDGLLLYNQDELNHFGTNLTGETEGRFSVETSLLDWQQIELEVLRDHAGRSELIGAVEYLDTAGVHPGNAIGVCPPQTLSDSLRSSLFKQARAIADHFNIIGGATIRFAYRSDNQDSLVLAVHPRHTTASALVTRTTGIPIARLTTLLTAGLTIDELPVDLNQRAQLSNHQDVVAIKWPKWDFFRLGHTNDRLGPQMQATGHDVSYGQSFLEALQKAVGNTPVDNGANTSLLSELDQAALEDLMPLLATPSSRRPYQIIAALDKGATVENIVDRTHMTPWFIKQFKQLATTAPQLKASLEKNKAAKGWQALPGKGNNLRYSTFGAASPLPVVQGDRKVIILGNGAYSIGNGAECEYGVFHAANAAKKMGFTPIVINSNLSSHMSGHNSPCTCYCETLTASEIMDVVKFENPAGIILQFSGEAANTLAGQLSDACQLMGTSWEAHQLQNDRAGFKEQIRQLGIPQPSSNLSHSAQAATESAEKIGFPVMISSLETSSSTLIRDMKALEDYLADNAVSEEQPVWIEQLLEYAIEAQAEVLCDGTESHTLAVMEHIELAGVHAGDSAAVLPPYSIAPRHVDTIGEYCHKLATALKIKGMLNIQFGIYRDTVYLLQAGSNISRNLAVVSKALDLPAVEWSTRLILGDKLTDLNISGTADPGWCVVRAPVFPFNSFSKIDPLLGPNMRATGQVMALSNTFGMAYFKAMESTSTPLPIEGTVLITVTDEDKSSILEPARIFSELGFNIMSTKGTHKALADNGIKSTQVRKLGFGRPNLVDEIKNGHVQIVINTPTGGQGQIDDSVIRKAAIRSRIANITTPASALAAAKGIAAAIKKES